MAKIPIILEAGRADGKLVTSNSIFDENKGMFQSEINDIQDTLNSDNSNKPLSAKQGKVLKELLDAKVIEVGTVPIDTEPIEGNTTHIVSSDGLAKEFNKCNTAIITTDRIENGAVTTDKIATSAFDSTLSVSGKIAPADVVGGKLTDLELEITNISGINIEESVTTIDTETKVSFTVDIPSSITLSISAEGLPVDIPHLLYINNKIINSYFYCQHEFNYTTTEKITSLSIQPRPEVTTFGNMVLKVNYKGKLDHIDDTLNHFDEIDNQIEGINNEITNIIKPSIEILTPVNSLSIFGISSKDFINRGYWDDNGVFSLSSNIFSTNLYRVFEGETVNYEVSNYGIYSMVVFDKQMNVIPSKCSKLAKGNYTIEEDVVFIAFVTRDVSIGQASFVQSNAALYATAHNNSLEISDIKREISKISTNFQLEVTDVIRQTANASFKEGDNIKISITSVGKSWSRLIVYYNSNTVSHRIIDSYVFTETINIDFIAPEDITSLTVWVPTYAGQEGTIDAEFSIGNDLIGDVESLKLDNETNKKNIEDLKNAEIKIDPKHRDNIIFRDFIDFSSTEAWSIQNGIATSPVVNDNFSLLSAPIRTAEDDYILSSRIKILSDNDGNFEAGIGKYDHAAMYASSGNYTNTERFLTICKNANGIYLKTYYAENSANPTLVEITEERKPIDAEISVGTEIVIRLSKITNPETTIRCEIFSENGELLANTESGRYWQCWGTPCVIVINGSAQFSKFTFSYPKKAYPKVSVYGDSYIEGASLAKRSDRYIGLLKKELGATECLCYGWGGGKGATDYIRVEYLQERIVPDYTIIAFGFNDATFDNWKPYADRFIANAIKQGSTPILVTCCPCGPNWGTESSRVQHWEKTDAINAWIRTSGYLYIDACKAVTTDGRNWKEGYLLADGAHPSVIGHMAIYNQIKMDCPFLFDL